MPAAEPLRLHLDVERDAVPITGVVHAEGCPSRPFVGWTDLFVALQAMVAQQPGDP